MLDLRVTAEGLFLPVQAQPGARRNGISNVHDGRLKVAVTQVAEKGKANAALVKLLSKSLGVSKGSITLVSGETSSQKVFFIRCDKPEELQQELQTRYETP